MAEQERAEMYSVAYVAEESNEAAIQKLAGRIKHRELLTPAWFELGVSLGRLARLLGMEDGADAGRREDSIGHVGETLWDAEEKHPVARTIVDLAKVSIGFETLGIDVQVQMEAYEDHALPWTTVPLKDHKPPTPYKNYTYYKPCHQNMTVANYKEKKRCAMPLLSQQWGPKFDASEVLGLEGAVQSQLSKQLAGVGFFTIDGFLSQKKGSARRFWHAEMQKLNETYKLPCVGDCCGCAGDDPFKPTPAPHYPHGSHAVQPGDSCWAIADKLCDDGNSWKDVICNAQALCSNLQVGTSIKYDCSGKGTYCPKQAEMFI